MRIYAFTDLHGNTKALQQVKEAVRKEEPDLVLCCGDLTVFEHGTRALLSRLNMLKVPVLIIHGNHEREDDFRKACAEFSRITFLHGRTLTADGWTFVGFGGGGFEDRYPELEALEKEWSDLDWSKTVVIAHAPPHGTSLDDVGEEGAEWHVGSKSLTKLIKRREPRLVLAGHIHEAFHREDRIGKTLVSNPGPSGKLFDLAKIGGDADG